jgi:hypothetical protein
MIRDLLQLVDIENKTLRQISQEADRKYAYVCKYVIIVMLKYEEYLVMTYS